MDEPKKISPLKMDEPKPTPEQQQPTNEDVLIVDIPETNHPKRTKSLTPRT